MEQLADRLRKARKSRMMTAKELSEASGIPSSTILGWETGRIEPTFFSLCCVAQSLNVSLEYLAAIEETDNLSSWQEFHIDSKENKLYKCEKCGSINFKESKFCPECGRRMKFVK